ncbi:butyrophilin subfamily 3 member A2 [Labrus bergylta]|uniref:butyrophilin subfamily 3 member A2 n=1 Tax=Labrus bergylta TaxID=56723 RepID=UPI0033143C0D
MSPRALIGAALLLCFTGGSSVGVLSQTVQALAGGDVILPCSFNTNGGKDFPTTVEWSKEGLHPNVIFLYRDRCETHEMKNPAFEYRTSLVTRELKNGNVSLRISNVQLSDAGTYRCMKMWRNAPRDITTLELLVGAVSEPRLSFTSAESGGVALQCEANCWHPVPDITFLDHQGNEISAADEQRKVQDGRGCSTVTRRLTLQEATKRVACRVDQPNTKQTRTTETLIPDGCMRSCFQTAGIAAGGTLCLLLTLCGLAFFFWKRRGKSGGFRVSRQSSNESAARGSFENQSFLQAVTVDNMDNLSREVANLKQKLQDTIRQLEVVSGAPLISSFGGLTASGAPEPTPREHRIVSNPEVLNITASLPPSADTSKKNRYSLDSQLMSSSSAQYAPDASSHRRRHSSVLPRAFKLHSGLQEESQPFM